MIRTSLFIGFALMASTSFASRNDLINDALNKNLEEREVVTGSYKENDAAERPTVVENRLNKDRIQVELDSQLASGSRNLRDFDNPTKTYREHHVEAHLDQEIHAVDTAFDKEKAHDVQKSSVRALLDIEG